jgi:hypothetical protein
LSGVARAPRVHGRSVNGNAGGGVEPSGPVGLAKGGGAK